MERTRSLKIVLFGDKSVGKRCLRYCSCRGHFMNGDYPLADAILDLRHQELCARIEILDLNWDVSLEPLQDQCIMSSHGFVVIYSVTDKESFLNLNKHIERIVKVRGEQKVPMLIVANKCDLEENRAVSIDAGFQFAAMHDAPFYEISAKLMINTQVMWLTLTRECIKLDDECGFYRTRKKKRKQCVIC